MAFTATPDKKVSARLSSGTDSAQVGTDVRLGSYWRHPPVGLAKETNGVLA